MSNKFWKGLAIAVPLALILWYIIIQFINFLGELL